MKRIKPFKDWNIFYKILSLNLGILPIILLTVLYVMPTMKSNIIEEKHSSIKKTVEIGYNIIKYYEGKEKSGEMSEADAKKSAINELANLKYGDNDYFWINDLNCNMVMHGAKPELNGQNMSEFKDPTGKNIFMEFVNTGKNAGGGFVEYMWPKPNYDKPVPKISYVMLLEDWGWVIGSGIYIVDVEEEYAALSSRIYIIMFLVIAVIVAVTLMTARKMAAPIKKLHNAANEFSKGNYRIKIENNSNDEIGRLTGAFKEMAEKIEQQFEDYDGLASPVVMIDKEFNITYMNRAGASLLGKEQKSLIGTKCYNQFKTDQCNTEDCACFRAMKTNEIQSAKTIARPLGKDLPIVYTGTPRRDRQENVIGAIEFIADITETKEQEKYLERSVEKILIEMEKLSSGDLNLELIAEKDNDDVSKLFKGFNKTVKNIREIIRNISESIQATLKASSEISSSSEEIATGAQEQSAQTAEIATAIEQMTRTILETTKNAGTASENAKKAGRMAGDGGKIVESTVESMKRISEVVLRATETVKQLGKSSSQIGEIIQVINDIADQTNLLALNAAIEAARAGEQGRGFSVVADEVRKLAERTTKATKEIANMIKQIQHDTNEAVESIETGAVEVENGKEMANKAGKSLIEVISAANQVVDDINQVASASEEQSTTAEQISRSIDAISNVSNESTSGIQIIAKSAEDLNNMTGNLQQLVKRFNIISEESEQETHYSIRRNGKLIKS